MTIFTKTLVSLTLGAAASLAGQNLEGVSISDLSNATLVSATPEQPVKWRKTYQWSVVLVGAATAADMASSFKFSRDGQREANGLLASRNRAYGAKGAAIQAGAVSASLLLQHYIVKHHPKLRLPMAIANFALGGAQAFNVRHNLNY